jgi:integrase
MADIRKRNGKNGPTYQVRYPSKATKSAYAYKSFKTIKEARHWQTIELPKLRQPGRLGIIEVGDAIDRWLDVCRFEGRRGKDPVSKATMAGYEYRAEIMKAYGWEKELHALEAPDIVAFRSWLLRHYPRDLARKVLSSFHSMIIQMNEQGVISHDPARTVTILADSRYAEPVKIPSIAEVRLNLETADRLANSSNEQIARAWKRYRPMIYLAADSGMRPQEYLALPEAALRESGVAVIQALGRDNEIGPPKTKAGRRFIPVGTETLRMVRHYADRHAQNELVFSTKQGGSYQSYRHYLRSGWHRLMDKSGLMVETEEQGETSVKPKYTPYSLRHFYASMLIDQQKNLKFIQTVMGHADMSTTFDVYGHLIQEQQAKEMENAQGILSHIVLRPTVS